MHSCFGQEEGKAAFWNTLELRALCSSTRSALRGDQFTRAYPARVLSEPHWPGEGKHPPPAHSSPRGKKKGQNSCEAHSSDAQAHRETRAQSEECGTLPFSLHLHHHVIQAYLQQFLSPFSFFVLLSRKRLLGLLKGQNHNVKRQSKHRTRHDRDVGIIRLGIEVSLISMVRVLGDKGDSMQGKMDNMSRDGNPKKEPQRDARDKKHWNRNEECFWWAY